MNKHDNQDSLNLVIFMTRFEKLEKNFNRLCHEFETTKEQLYQGLEKLYEKIEEL
jgi:uncharacterized protein Yka (UPF0111/DUF47 family)